MKLTKIIATLLSVGVISSMSPVQAQELTGTLAKIKKAGSVTLGVRDGSVPFSYLDDKQQYQGYSIDLCMKVVTALQKHLGLSELKVVMSPVTSANRIPLMANGTIDLECGSTTNNLERQQQVAFAPTMFVIGNRVLAKKSSNIKTLEDLRGKTLVAPAFKKVVDDALIRLYKSDDINRIYAKWFTSPIPPKNINLKFPMPPQLKAVFANPTDSGDPAAYAAVPEAQKTSDKRKK